MQTANAPAPPAPNPTPKPPTWPTRPDLTTETERRDAAVMASRSWERARLAADQAWRAEQ